MFFVVLADQGSLREQAGFALRTSRVRFANKQGSLREQAGFALRTSRVRFANKQPYFRDRVML